MDSLIVVAELSNHPSEPLAFRLLTIDLKHYKRIPVLLETEDYARDIYFRTLKSRGLFDGISEIITPEDHEEGIRLDTKLSYPKTVRTDRIYFGNMISLIQQIMQLERVAETLRIASDSGVRRPNAFL